MASNQQWTLPKKPTGVKKNLKEHQQSILNDVTEMFGSTLENDVILSVVRKCNWKLQSSIDTLIALSAKVETSGPNSNKNFNKPNTTLSHRIRNQLDESTVNIRDANRTKWDLSNLNEDFTLFNMNDNEVYRQQEEFRKFEQLKNDLSQKRLETNYENMTRFNCTVNNKVTPSKLQQFKQSWSKSPQLPPTCNNLQETVLQDGRQQNTILNKPNVHRNTPKQNYNPEVSPFYPSTDRIQNKLYRKGIVPKNLPVKQRNNKSMDKGIQNAEGNGHVQPIPIPLPYQRKLKNRNDSQLYNVFDVEQRNRTQDLPKPSTDIINSQQLAIFDSSTTIHKSETESLCGLKVQYRIHGLENSSDDDADVVIEEKPSDYNILPPPIIPSMSIAPPCQSFASVTRYPAKCQSPKVRPVYPRLPPKTPQKNAYDLTINRIETNIRQGYKILILLRGLPGSGKSYLANNIVSSTIADDPALYIFSSDDYFITRNGEYCYDSLRLHEAHINNQNKVRNAMKKGRSPVIVDNTNTQSWEMHPYAEMAVKYGYIVEVLEPNTPWSQNLNELAKKNFHCVPKSKIKQMQERYERNIDGTKLLQLFSLQYSLSCIPPQPRLIPPLSNQQQTVISENDKTKTKRNRRRKFIDGTQTTEVSGNTPSPEIDKELKESPVYNFFDNAKWLETSLSLPSESQNSKFNETSNSMEIKSLFQDSLKDDFVRNIFERESTAKVDNVRISEVKPKLNHTDESKLCLSDSTVNQIWKSRSSASHQNLETIVSERNGGVSGENNTQNSGTVTDEEGILSSSLICKPTNEDDHNSSANLEIHDSVFAVGIINEEKDKVFNKGISSPNLEARVWEIEINPLQKCHFSELKEEDNLLTKQDLVDSSSRSAHKILRHNPEEIDHALLENLTDNDVNEEMASTCQLIPAKCFNEIDPSANSLSTMLQLEKKETESAFSSSIDEVKVSENALETVSENCAPITQLNVTESTASVFGFEEEGDLLSEISKGSQSIEITENGRPSDSTDFNNLDVLQKLVLDDFLKNTDIDNEDTNEEDNMSVSKINSILNKNDDNEVVLSLGVEANCGSENHSSTLHHNLGAIGCERKSSITTIETYDGEKNKSCLSLNLTVDQDCEDYSSILPQNLGAIGSERKMSVTKIETNAKNNSNIPEEKNTLCLSVGLETRNEKGDKTDIVDTFDTFLAIDIISDEEDKVKLDTRSLISSSTSEDQFWEFEDDSVQKFPINEINENDNLSLKQNSEDSPIEVEQEILQTSFGEIDHLEDTLLITHGNDNIEKDLIKSKSQDEEEEAEAQCSSAEKEVESSEIVIDENSQNCAPVKEPAATENSALTIDSTLENNDLLNKTPEGILSIEPTDRLTETTEDNDELTEPLKEDDFTFVLKDIPAQEMMLFDELKDQALDVIETTTSIDDVDARVISPTEARKLTEEKNNPFDPLHFCDEEGSTASGYSKKPEFIDNIHEITWKEAPFPAGDVPKLLSTNNVLEDKKIITSESSTNTCYYDFNVLFVGGTTESSYKVMDTFNRSINEKSVLVRTEKLPLKFMLDKSSMASEVDILNIEESSATGSDSEVEKCTQELMEMFPHVPKEYLEEIYKTWCGSDFNWAVDVLLEGVPDAAEIEYLKLKPEKVPTEEDTVSTTNKSSSASSQSINDNPSPGHVPSSGSRKKKDRKKISETELELKKEIEEKLRIKETSYHPHILRVKRWKNRETDISAEEIERQVADKEVIEFASSNLEDETYSQEFTANFQEDGYPYEPFYDGVELVDEPLTEGFLAKQDVDNEVDCEIDTEDTIELNLGQNCVKILETEFGNPEFQFPDGLLPVIRLRKSVAQELYALWIESIQQQLTAQQEQIDLMIAKDAEYAKSLEQEEASALPEVVVPKLDEVMDMEMALAIYNNDLKEQVKRETPNDMASRLTRKMLHEMFSEYNPNTLNEILAAHDGNFKETVEILEISTGKSFSNADALKKQMNLMDEVKQNTSTPTNQSTATSTVTPIIVVNPDLNYSNNKSDRLAYKSSLQKAYLARQEVLRQLSLRNENLNKATQAYRKGNPNVAAYYSEMAKLHTKNIETANATAAAAFLAAQGFSSNEANTLDLHYLFVPEALEALDQFLDNHVEILSKSNKRSIDLYIVTGRGARSNNGVSRIKPAVSKRLAARKIRFMDANPGCLKVILNRRNNTLD
ncbi:uncharacterized protein LOC105699863 [Orussus abietinus]|uniref:uncharacterized protein LOC105699863 n=1 Tax=Orussus abietinus TaxID=222816 RepID=UPI000626BDD5|nr:uncharacterized protein LOC105699863 [Orussus abietinus]